MDYIIHFTFFDLKRTAILWVMKGTYQWNAACSGFSSLSILRKHLKDSYEIQNFALEDYTQDTTKVSLNKATKSQVKQICQSTYIKQRSQNTSEIHRDTTLGGSEHYNTYKKNEYGAGAVTTNARKK